MGRFVRGDVVVVPYPLKSGESKRRPALVLAEVEYGRGTDYLVCIMTSQNDPNDGAAIEVSHADAVEGQYMKDDDVGTCYIRPHYIWTCVEATIIRRIDRLSDEKMGDVLVSVRAKFA